MRRGAAERHRVLADHGERRAEPLGQRKVVEADDGRRGGVVEAVEHPEGDQVVAGEQGRRWLRQPAQLGEGGGGRGAGAQAVPDQGGVGGDAVGGEGVEVAGVAFGLRPDLVAVAEEGDPGVAVAEQMGHRALGACPVVDGDGVHREAPGGTVHADHPGAVRHRPLKEAVVPDGGHDDQTVHLAGGEGGDHLALAARLVIGAGDQHHTAAAVGLVLDRAGHQCVEGVGEVVDHQTDGCGGGVLLPQVACVVVALVAEPADRAFDLGRGGR